MSPKEQGQKMEYLWLGLDVTAPRLAFINANNLPDCGKKKKKHRRIEAAQLTTTGVTPNHPI